MPSLVEFRRWQAERRRLRLDPNDAAAWAVWATKHHGYARILTVPDDAGGGGGVPEVPTPIGETPTPEPPPTPIGETPFPTPAPEPPPGTGRGEPDIPPRPEESPFPPPAPMPTPTPAQPAPGAPAPVGGGQAQRPIGGQPAGGARPSGPSGPTAPGTAQPFRDPNLDVLGKQWQDVFAAMISGNRERFEEAVRQFNATLQQTQQRNFADFATDLLRTAATLRGPQDWPKYLEFAAGGRNLTRALYGNEPIAAFQAPSGYSQPVTIGDILKDVGLVPNVPGFGELGQTYDKVLASWAQRGQPELKGPTDWATLAAQTAGIPYDRALTLGTKIFQFRTEKGRFPNRDEFVLFDQNLPKPKQAEPARVKAKQGAAA